MKRPLKQWKLSSPKVMTENVSRLVLLKTLTDARDDIIELAERLAATREALQESEIILDALANQPVLDKVRAALQKTKIEETTTHDEKTKRPIESRTTH